MENQSNQTDQVPLTVQEALALTQEHAFWDGFAAGAQSVVERAKRAAVERIVNARRPAQTVGTQPPPAS